MQHELRVTLGAMKNVTVTMEDHVADWARMEAARRNTSVSRLVGEMLAEKMRHDDAYERALQDWLHRERSWVSDGRAYPGREVL
ncbi:CopG family transcriptional regulator [Roseateles sp. BYS180W]|uniref:CopG family transcriptional regulator n=1 Tax=Roseateles rivi TaxID=3299028 RepID=A0ABW7FXG5_9BURK